MKKFVFALLLPVLAFQVSAQSLKEVFAKDFLMGVSLSGRNVRSTAEQDLIRKEFNSVTCENAMKPASLHPSPNTWRWEEADRIANFCRENGIKMRGHCLVWHNQFSDWMLYDETGNFVDKEVFYARLKDHIQTVMNRYKDVIYAWDVVNEAMSDGGTNPYRESKLYQLCGDEFIAKAFQFAREADPKAVLFYNDYNECDRRKSRNIYNMVLKMRSNGVPIDGIGMQGHYNIFKPTVEELDAALALYSPLVEHIHITELDVRVNREMGGQLQFSQEGAAMSDSVQALHAQQYERLFKTFQKYSDKIDCVTFWNLHDGCSWLGERNHPLLFDKDLQPKPAYHRLVGRP
ncbi:MAG: endo-1,4-beta-xylanase [Bacteroidaceae bacterium]|nr:endo-1,4-beta-xylanase [Bacteroidaceae bacterium]